MKTKNTKPDDIVKGRRGKIAPSMRPYTEEPDDGSIPKYHHRDMPSGKFSDKKKGTNKGEIGRKWDEHFQK